MKRLFLILLLITVLASPCMAQEPVHRHWLARGFVNIGHETKQTLIDPIRHPVRYGIPFALRQAAMWYDIGQACRLNMQEVGPAKYFIGNYPKCHKFVLLGIIGGGANEVSVHWLTRKFQDTCEGEAADPNSRWNHTDAHTHQPWCGTPLNYSIAFAEAGMHIPAILHNRDLENGKP